MNKHHLSFPFCSKSTSTRVEEDRNKRKITLESISNLDRGKFRNERDSVGDRVEKREGYVTRFPEEEDRGGWK